MKRWKLLLTLAGVTAIHFTGCGGDEADPNESTGPGTPTSTKSVATADTKPIPNAVSPGEPDQAVRNVLEGIRDGKGQAIWSFLPSRYQKDINQLVQDFAGRVDAKVWNRTFAFFKRIADVTRNKKDLLINNPGLELRAIDQKQLDEHWPALLGLFDTLLTSELKEVKTLKSFDGSVFFSGTGSKFLEQLRSLSATDPADPLSSLASSSISVLERNGDSARLQIGSGGTADKPLPPSNFVVIDGKWFPSELAAALDEALRLGRAALDRMPKSATAESGKKWLAVLDTLDAVAASLEKSDNLESFNKALSDAQLALIPLLDASSSNEPRPANLVTTITVVLQGAMDEKERRDHIAALRTLTQTKDVPDFTASNDATTVILTTTLPIQSIVDGITFGKVTRVDELKRTITVSPGQNN